MRHSGMILLIIGFVSGVLALFQYLLATTPVQPPPEGPSVTTLPAVQLYFAAATLLAGGLLVAFGSSGVIKSNDPEVRN